MNYLKKVMVVLGLAVILPACAGESIFPPVPLTLSPPTLVNPIAMAASSTSQRLYLVNSNNQVFFVDASFYIFDISVPANPTAVAAISIPNFSGQIQLDETRGFVYIPNRQSSSNADNQDQVLRININEASPTFLTTDLFDSDANPFGGFFDGMNNLYVACQQEALLYDVNSFSGFTQVDLSVQTNLGADIDASETREIILSPSGNTVWVSNQSDSFLILTAAEFPPPTVSGVTDLGTAPVDYIVTGDSSTLGLAKDAQFIYMVDALPQSLHVMTDAGLTPVVGQPLEINISSLQVAQIPVGSTPSEVIVDPANARAYVSNNGSDDISVIDLNLFKEITRISVAGNLPPGTPVGDEPFGMTLANIGGTNFLYVANFNTSNVTIINADALSVIGGFPPDVD